MADLTVSINGAPVPIYLGESTALASLLAGAANEAADTAQSAAAAALAAAGVGEYADTTAGLAATTTGETFWVDLGNGLGQVYRHDAGPVATALHLFIIDPTGGDAASLIGTAGGGNVQQAIPYITPQMKGGTWDVDSTAALEDTLLGIINTDQPALINKRIRVDGAVETAANISLQGTGLIDLSGGGSLKFGTGVTALPDLGANILVGASSISFDDDHGLAVGDVIAAWNPTDYSQAPFRPYYRAGDMFRVADIISATEVRIFGTAKSAFAAADMKMFKLNGGRVSWDGVGLIPSAAAVPMFLDGCVGVNLNRLRIEAGANGTAVEIFRCFGTIITAPDIVNLTTEDGYPIVISNSQNGIINGMSEVYSGWHCVAFGGRTGDASVPTADWLITNVIARNMAHIGVGALDTHGGCKRITYDGFVSDAAFNPGGEDITLRNGKIYGVSPASHADGAAIYASQVTGGTFLFENIHAISAGNGEAFGSHVHLDIGRIRKDFRFVARNFTAENVGASPATARMFNFGVGTTDPPASTIDISIDGLSYAGAEPPFTAVAISGVNDVSATTKIRMSNISGVERLFGASATANYNIGLAGPGSRRGVAQVGDASTTLTRDSARNQLFATDITANRNCDLPLAANCANGDEFVITRTGGGNDNVTVRSGAAPRLASLAPGDWVRCVFQGLSGFGAWVVAERGSVFELTGVATFGDVSAFIELTRTSQFLGRKVNIWNQPLTANHSVAFDGGAKKGDTLRFVRTAAATGAFALDIAGVKNLAAGQWCDIMFDGAAWVVIAAGDL